MLISLFLSGYNVAFSSVVNGPAGTLHYVGHLLQPVVRLKFINECIMV